VVIGNLAWGFVGDRLGSKRALQLAVVGDVVTFAITPFVRDPVLLLVVRVFAGLSTPLVTSLLFIFERAKSPADTIKGMGHYTLAVIGAYMVGSALVSSLIDSVGFRGVTLVTAGIALFALTWTTFLSAPSSVTERQKPSGVRYALGSRGFRVHGMVSFAVGASLNGVMLLPTWLMFDHFKFSAQQVGYPCACAQCPRGHRTSLTPPDCRCVPSELVLLRLSLEQTSASPVCKSRRSLPFEGWWHASAPTPPSPSAP
jgi:MFS family permease